MDLKRRHLQQQLLVVVIGGIILTLSATKVKAASQIINITKPGCLESCGSVSIPYPFGTSRGCYLDESFLVICNSSYNPPKLFFPRREVQIISNISLDDGKLGVASPIARECYNELGNLTTTPNESFISVTLCYNNFPSLDLLNLKNRDTLPVVLEWSVGNETCEIAKQNKYAYACVANNSECLNSSNAGGYRCRCSQGYNHGNPYLPDGCQECSKGGCKDPGLAIVLGVSCGLLTLGGGGSWIYWELKKRMLNKLKEHFFQQNGGTLLQSQLSQYSGSEDMAKVFTTEELNMATDNYDESRIPGKRVYRTVYKGVLAANKMVAIKKSKIGDQSQIEQFINEVIVLSQVNHPNVVKLIGCCLETEVPLLVYEFFTNVTLSDHIHNKGQHSSLSWEMRLKIATETASALAYLHSSASMPIIHRDVKAANILLDENYTAKVAYFGASRLVPLDQTELIVQGTLGYLDPEYLHTSQLTEKSDVYSFGVVLAELLTGEKVLSSERRECDRNLAFFFVSSMKEDRLLQILDNHIVVNDERSIQRVKEVANLARRCLGVRGEERPSMKEVATELEGLTKEMPAQRYKMMMGDNINDVIQSEETEWWQQS